MSNTFYPTWKQLLLDNNINDPEPVYSNDELLLPSMARRRLLPAPSLMSVQSVPPSSVASASAAYEQLLLSHSYSQPFLASNDSGNDVSKLSSSLNVLPRKRVSEENLLAFHEQVVVSHSAAASRLRHPGDKPLPFSEQNSAASNRLLALSEQNSAARERLLALADQVRNSSNVDVKDVNVSGTNFVRIQVGGGGGGLLKRSLQQQHQQVSRVGF